MRLAKARAAVGEAIGRKCRLWRKVRRQADCVTSGRDGSRIYGTGPSAHPGDYRQTGASDRRQRTMKGWGYRRSNSGCYVLRIFYRFFLLKNRDRRVTEITIAFLLIVLAGLTWLDFDGRYHCYPAVWQPIWHTMYVLLIASIAFPSFCMYLGRQLRKFVFGWTREDMLPSDAQGSNPFPAKERGRLHALGVAYLARFKCIVDAKVAKLPTS